MTIDDTAERRMVPAGSISREDFRRLADLALKSAGGQRTFFSLQDVESGTTRFANNEIVQHVQARRTTLAVTVAFGQQHATAIATDFGEETIRETVQSAERIARLSPVDPEYVPPLRPQDYPPLETCREETVCAGPERRVDFAVEATAMCRARDLTAAGIVSTALHVYGVASDTGLFAYEPRSEARFSLTAMGPRSSGWAANVHRSIERLDVVGRTRRAVEQAQAFSNPRELPPGRYTVVLEPAAVAGLIAPLVWALDAKSYYKGTSPFLKKLGRLIIDRRLTLRNVPDDPDLLGNGFNSEGLPAAHMTWIEHGILQQLRYDRYTAQEHHVYPSPSLDAPSLSADGADPSSDQSLESLIAQTERGILVSNFWYIRSVNPTDLTLTGMTRDGTFLIEHGQVTARLVDFRWHDSPLRVLAQVDSMTAPTDAVSNEGWKMKLPALKVRDFNFSSVSRL